MFEERRVYLGEGDKKVLLVFNFNVMSQVQETWGSLTKWVGLLDTKTLERDEFGNPIPIMENGEQAKDESGELLYKVLRDGEPDFTALRQGFSYMLNEGVEIENEERPADQKKAPYTVNQTGRLIALFTKEKVSQAIKMAVTDSLETGEKAEEKPADAPSDDEVK
jgi:hypothetical protein